MLTISAGFTLVSGTFILSRLRMSPVFTWPHIFCCLFTDGVFSFLFLQCARILATVAAWSPFAPRVD
jgi:hypothetical protein